MERPFTPHSDNQEASWDGKEGMLEEKCWSQYHTGCVSSPQIGHYRKKKRTPSHPEGDGKTENNSKLKEIRTVNMSYKRKISLKRFGSICGAGASVRELIDLLITEDLDEFGDYITSNVSTGTLERWLSRKTHMTELQRRQQPQEPLYRLRVSMNPAEVIQAVLGSIATHPMLDQVVWELSYCIAMAIGTDGFNIYTRNDQNSIVVLVGSLNDKPVRRTKIIRKLNTLEEIFSRRISRPYRAPKVYDPKDLSKGDTRDPTFSLYFPIDTKDNYYVVELYRDKHKFYDEDEEMVVSYMVWGNITLHYVRMSQELQRQEKLSDYILHFARSIFQDIENEEILVEKIMKYAQELVQADRASLFLVDQKNQELYATIFDLGKNQRSGDSSVSSVDEIRFPIGKGIAGCVAQTGETLNITDAYCDDRFNRSVDLKTGYKTRSILCMPISSRGQIIGVVQMVNKCNGTFTTSDVEAFKVFAVYCGLALHNSKLYTRIKRSESKYRVAMDVLSYHNTCTSDEVRAGLHDLDSVTVSVDNFYFDPSCLTSYQKVLNVVQMFIDLFDLVDFNKTYLVRFVLTVKKNYRRLPYHNWTHGYSVCNTMYNIIKRSSGAFTRNECLALFVGALCHDLDHRGKNNKFMLETESPLASMYSTSTMEHHHFNQTVMVLNQEHHNIFVNLPNEDYKAVLKMLKHCILATDLALFFPNKDKLSKLLAFDQFNWDIPEHRDYAMATAMTASDLSASAKPWSIQASTVDVIFKEFYEQGDAEREAGINPLPMMDRNRPEELPSSQVGFLEVICKPCMSMLSKILPETTGLHRGCQQNLKRWLKIKSQVQAFIQQERDAAEIYKYMKNLIENETLDESPSNSSLDLLREDESDVIQTNIENPKTLPTLFKDVTKKAEIYFDFYDEEQICSSPGADLQKPSGSRDADLVSTLNSLKICSQNLTETQTDNTVIESACKKDNRPDRVKKTRARAKGKHVTFVNPSATGHVADPPHRWTVLSLKDLPEPDNNESKSELVRSRIHPPLRRIRKSPRQLFLVKSADPCSVPNQLTPLKPPRTRPNTPRPGPGESDHDVPTSHLNGTDKFQGNSCTHAVVESVDDDDVLVGGHAPMAVKQPLGNKEDSFI